MSMSLGGELQEKVERIARLRREFDRLRGRDLGSRPRPPASEEEVVAAEQHVGMSFPPDYRAFLLLHNGWYRFDGENHILSTDQLQQGQINENITAIKELERRNREPVADGFVIVASESGTDVAYFDPRTRRPDGRMDVVRWGGDVGEYRRLPGFAEYLDHYAASLERRIAKENSRLR
jgi:hypothetical protein